MDSYIETVVGLNFLLIKEPGGVHKTQSLSGELAAVHYHVVTTQFTVLESKIQMLP